MTDGPDEALVVEVAKVLSDVMLLGPIAGSLDEELKRDARAVLAHLAARLIPADAEQREEWGGRRPDGERRIVGMYDRTGADAFVAKFGGSVVRRTVRTWTGSDGSVGTLVGPWVEVEG